MYQKTSWLVLIFLKSVHTKEEFVYNYRENRMKHWAMGVVVTQVQLGPAMKHSHTKECVSLTAHPDWASPFQLQTSQDGLAYFVHNCINMLWLKCRLHYTNLSNHLLIVINLGLQHLPRLQLRTIPIAFLQIKIYLKCH